MFGEPQRWRLILNALIAIGGIVLAVSTNSFAFPQPANPELIQGSAIVAKVPCTTFEGPDQGLQIGAGTIVLCSQLEGDRVWVSGAFSGWAAAKEFANLRSAESIWVEHVRRYPSEWDSIATLAYIKLYSGKIRESHELIGRLRNAPTKSPYVRVIIAALGWDRDDYQREIEILCNERAFTPRLAEIAMLEMIDIADFDSAEKVFKSVQWNEGEVSAEFLRHAAYFAYRNDDLDRARHLVDLAILNDPYFNSARRLRASILFKQGAHEEARLEVQECIRLWPKDAAAHRQLGMQHVKSKVGNVELGVKHIRIAFDLAPTDPKLDHDTGRDLLWQAMANERVKGNTSVLDMAALSFERACSLTNFDRLEYVNSLCVTYGELRNYDKAYKLIKQLLSKYDLDAPERKELLEIQDYVTSKSLEDKIFEAVKSNSGSKSGLGRP